MAADCLLERDEPDLLYEVLSLSQAHHLRIEAGLNFYRGCGLGFGLLAACGGLDPFQAKAVNVFGSILALSLALIPSPNALSLTVKGPKPPARLYTRDQTVHTK